jgi:hypothetical protein
MDGNGTLPDGTGLASGQSINLLTQMSPGTHAFTVNAMDNLNNAGAKTTTFTIIVTPDSLEQDVTILSGLGCIDNYGIGNALTGKLEEVKSRMTAGDTQAGVNTLMALLSQAQAQAGKHITFTCTDPNSHTQFNAAQVLITDIEALLANLKTSGITDPILGYVLNATGGGVNGAVVSLVDSANTIVASMNTDPTGFYFFAQTNALVSGGSFTVSLSTIPSLTVRQCLRHKPSTGQCHR